MARGSQGTRRKKIYDSMGCRARLMLCSLASAIKKVWVMWLAEKSFIEVTRNTPLVSIDLLVDDGKGRFLLGKRINKPAQGLWFVPGGRILKNQTISEAFSSLASRELNLDLTLRDSRLRGVYEHFYEDNFFDIAEFGTHYIVLAYNIAFPHGAFDKLPGDQHSEWAFMTPLEIEERIDVHRGSKLFFRW
jgi:colanic acid biosynthesis protein WcaH